MKQWTGWSGRGEGGGGGRRGGATRERRVPQQHHDGVDQKKEKVIREGRGRLKGPPTHQESSELLDDRHPTHSSNQVAKQQSSETKVTDMSGDDYKGRKGKGRGSGVEKSRAGGREDGGGQRQHKRGERERGRKREGIAATLQSDQLSQQLTTGSYECMVCCEGVREREEVWSCRSCFHIFHLRCIRRWAKSPAAAVDEGKPLPIISVA